MKHRPRPPEQDDLLRPRLVELIDPRHELVKLAVLIGVALPLVIAGLPQLAAAGIGGLQDGTYDAFDCSVPISDRRVAVSGDTLAFYESSCRLSNPQTLRGQPEAVLLHADCMGEGQIWSARFVMMQTRDGGLAFLQEGWSGHYARCNE